MNKNSKSVKHAKAVLKYWDKPFCTCLLRYIDELEKKAYKCEYYEEHANIFYQELTEIREDNALNKFIIEKIKKILARESNSSFDYRKKLEQIRKEYNNILSSDNVSLEFKNINSHRFDAMSQVLEELLKGI